MRSSVRGSSRSTFSSGTMLAPVPFVSVSSIQVFAIAQAILGVAPANVRGYSAATSARSSTSTSPSSLTAASRSYGVGPWVTMARPAPV